LSKNEKIRVAMVGGAGIWGRYYLRAFAAHPNCKIVALVDTARERRQAFAERYGIEKTCDTVDQLLADEIPDIVSTSIPVGHNHAVVTTCARAGVKVVSCEKPIAPTLADADEMVRVCREHGTAFACGTAHWEIDYLPDIAAWIRDGNIGRLTAAAIPGGLPREVSGSGCVQLTMLRLLTGMEVEWVEGFILPREENWLAPEDASDEEIDSPAYGRLGLSGGIVCEILPPQEEYIPCRISVTGEDGQVWAGSPQSVLVKGKGPTSTPVRPDFLEEKWSDDFFRLIVERLMRAVGNDEAECSGHDYRQALEIAIAIKQSAARDNQRVSLPLEDRSLCLFPHLYRLRGGDVIPWEKVGYSGPPEVPPLVSTFDDLVQLDDQTIQLTIYRAERKDLEIALVGAGPEVTEKILDNMSKKERSFTEEEINRLENLSPEEIEAARTEIVSIACAI
jgi:predicted dehydrogenase